MAQCIAVPHDHPAQRLPTFPNLERTAVMPMISTGTISVPSGTSREFALFRSPSYPLWAATPSTTNASLYLYCSGTSLPQGTIGTVGSSVAFSPDVLEPGTVYTQGTDTAFTTAYGPLYCLGRSKDNRIFAKSASTGYSGIAITFDGAPGAGSKIAVTFEIFDGSEYDFATITNVDASAALTVVMSNTAPFLGCWWRPVSITVTTAFVTARGISNVYAGVSTSASLQSPANGALVVMLPVFSPPEISLSSLPYQSTRSTAVAALFSNATAVLSKEGTVLCGRVPRAGVTGIWFANTLATGLTGKYTTLINDIHAKDRYYGLMENGLYTSMLPDESSSEFADHYGSNPSIKGMFDLEGYNYVNLIVLSDLDSGAITTMAVTVDNHLEFRSTSMLFPVGYCRASLESYHVAQMALAEQGCFFENPVHLAAIGSLIRSAVTRLAPIVLPYAKQAAVAVGSHLVSSASKKLGNMMGTQATLQPSQRLKPREKRKQKRVVAKPRR
jgi:hypothetical protein